VGHAETKERARMLIALFERIKADTVNGELWLVPVPRPGWTPFFARS
jgi:hypothetical protein